MKAIQANPKSLREIFQSIYVIPEFQRPYSWEIEQCSALWSDLTSFYNDDPEPNERYFIGSIVVYNDKDVTERDAFSVVDGQQRLTTLFLLIRALFDNARTAAILEQCLRINDPLTGDLTQDLRIQSRVIGTDKKSLESIIIYNGSEAEGNIKINFDLLKKLIGEWISKDKDTKKINKLILTLLDKVVMLPINCEEQDDALGLFQTLNDRGLPLGDIDIFKAKIYGNIPASPTNIRDDFIKEWNALNDHAELFRIYMHIFRAEQQDISKEIALRRYFQDKLNNHEQIVNALKKISTIRETEISIESDIYWHILTTTPNEYWQYPLYVFLYLYGKLDENGNIKLSELDLNNYNFLIVSTIRFFFIKGIVHNTVNSVKDSVFKICSHIYKSYQDKKNTRNFLSAYNVNDDEYQEFRKKLKENRYSGRYLKGLILLAAMEQQKDKNSFLKILDGKYDIEHILPKKWNNYDKWDQSNWELALNTLGNLMPLEKTLNIYASNLFFDRKKNEYGKSSFEQAKQICSNKNWYPNDHELRHKKQLSILYAFFDEVKSKE